ncbi:MAG: galactokinase [Gemmatimonadetes bacterium]|nr:galactokinase [Gemmatimonadota bacterium]
MRLIDASRHTTLRLPLRADVPPRPGAWSDYPISVIRRLARDFPGAHTGMDAVLISSLPSASGLSSSSALVIATFLPLAAFNRMEQQPGWGDAIPDQDALAGYLGAMENGKVFGPFGADRGVGTHGGSEDHTAILRCAPGALAQYRFLPVAPEAHAALPAGWTFAIGVSGVHAAKGGAVQEHYNGLARQLALLLATWRRISGTTPDSLLAALAAAPEAREALAQAVRLEHPAEGDDLVARLGQFAEECETIIPSVTQRLQQGDPESIGSAVDRSQELAETVLANQVPETVQLVRSARRLGAAAASAFGAGFGGSVWALVREAGSTTFLAAWKEHYLLAFPARAGRATFFASRPGAAAGELPD